VVPDIRSEMNKMNRPINKTPDGFSNPFSARSSLHFRESTIDLPPDDCLLPGSLPKWMPDVRSRQTTARIHQLSQSSASLQNPRACSPHLYDWLRQLDVKTTSECHDQIPCYVAEGGRFIPEDESVESSSTIDLPIRVSFSCHVI